MEELRMESVNHIGLSMTPTASLEEKTLTFHEKEMAVESKDSQKSKKSSNDESCIDANKLSNSEKEVNNEESKKSSGCNKKNDDQHIEENDETKCIVEETSATVIEQDISALKAINNENKEVRMATNSSEEEVLATEDEHKTDVGLQSTFLVQPTATVSGTKSEADPEALRNLIVNYLPPLMDETQLYQLFLQFGPIESVKIIFDKQTHESRGYGFVKYYFFFSATYAIACLNRFSIGGKRLKVAYAHAENAKEALVGVKESVLGFTPPQQLAYSNMYYGQMAFMQRECYISNSLSVST